MKTPMLLATGAILAMVVLTSARSPAVPAQNPPPTFGVLVKNDETRPIPVRERPREPFMVDNTFVTAGGSTQVYGDVTSVPPGKMFVIEFVSASMSTNSVTDIIRLQMNVSHAATAPTTVIRFPFERLNAGPGGRSEWGYSSATRLYAVGNVFVNAGRPFNAGSGNFILRVALSGFLVDA